MSPKALREDEIDPVVEEMDRQMMESGEDVAIPQHKFDANRNFGDLSDGGQVGDARLITQDANGRVIFDKNKREPGRPTVRNVWTWDGKPSTIPLAWDADGKKHDGGRKYLYKRHCTICNFSGFYGRVCPQCRKDGRELAPPVPAFYLKKEQVPAQQVFFGKVDCFVPTCVRRGKWGFLSDTQMREHAMGRHQKEYKAYQDAAVASNAKKLDEMQSVINTLLMERAGMIRTDAPVPPEPETYIAAPKAQAKTANHPVAQTRRS